MNKKTIITLALVLSFFFVANFTNAASETNILPSNPFYFFKDLGRQIQDVLTFNNEAKVELRLKVAEEKLAEIEKMAEENPNNPNYEKYLEKYEEAVEKVQEKIDKVQTKKEEILEKITSKMLEQEQKLEQLKNTIRSDKEEAINRIRSNVMNQYTETSLKIADENAVQNKIRERIQNMDEEKAAEVVNRIEEKAPQNLKSILNKIEIVQKIKEKGIENSGQALKETIQNEQLTNKVNRDAAKLGLTPEEILKQIESFSEEDKKTLEQYALDILTGNKSEEDIANDFNQIKLSPNALQKLEALKTTSQERTQNQGQITEVRNQNQNTTSNNAGSINTTSLIDEASRYCIKQGNKVLVEKDSTGKEIKMCISPNNKKCRVEDYYNKKCTF